MYEGRLKELNPGVPNISYDISDLFAYIDSLQDLAVLVCVWRGAAAPRTSHPPPPTPQVRRQEPEVRPLPQGLDQAAGVRLFEGAGDIRCRWRSWRPPSLKCIASALHASGATHTRAAHACRLPLPVHVGVGRLHPGGLKPASLARGGAGGHRDGGEVQAVGARGQAGCVVVTADGI